MVYYITLVGKRASGKDTFSDYVKETYGIPFIKFSTVIIQLGVELGLITPNEMKDKAKVQILGNTLRSQYGGRSYTERLARQIKGRTYTINGARHPIETTCLREILGNKVLLVGIVSDTERRYERARLIGIVSSSEHFQELESNSAETNIDTLLQQADHIIVNNTELEEFYKAIDDFMAQLKISKIY